ncbi:unnamed protein product [Notodromas monacha]|uniref:Uncharacterized protein n=1 Tax=Notodromas monacha TaxID=399045 RepID=A0A7R9BZ62_9CRUS|nr:unnamed protein product [Notodromas monacha]CAG0922812.1 unnamed protein product [Notodromas monacha]
MDQSASGLLSWLMTRHSPVPKQIYKEDARASFPYSLSVKILWMLLLDEIYSNTFGAIKAFMEMAIVIANDQEESGMDPTDVRMEKNDIFFTWHRMAFLKIATLLLWLLVGAGADCGPEDGVFKCRDLCGEEVRDASGYRRRVTFIGSTLFLDCVRQADLKEVKLVSPTVCVARRVEMDRVVKPWRWCEEVVPPKLEISTAAVPPVVDEPCPVVPTANLAVVHMPASKTPFVVWAPPSTQQSVVVAQEVPHVIRAPSSTLEVTVNIKHGVAHVEADVDPWTAMVLVFMGLGGAGATSLAVFLVWLVKFIRNKSSYMRELVRMLTLEDQQDPEAQPVVDLLGLEEADKPVAEEKEEELVLEDNNPFKEMLNA